MMRGLKRLLYCTLICATLLPTSLFAQGLSGQKFFCNVGYTQKACSEQMAVLRSVLAKYHAERLGPWTWVLVKSTDWKDIGAPRGLNTNSPAFTYLEKRKTFFEEALFTTVPGRNSELQRYWSLPANQLLELAVTHELGHAICGEPDEQRADTFGKLERTGAQVACPATSLNSTFARGADKPGELPFKLVQGFGIVVRGEIGSTKNLNFLLDTGAVPSVLGQRAAAQMGIRGARGPLTLLNKERQAEYVSVDEVQLGWIRAARLPMVIVELAHLEQRLGTRIDAIIGLDMLVGQDISIDYKHRKITRGLSGLARHSVDVETFTASGAPYWVVPISLGGVGFRVLLDTGANDVALFAPSASRTFTLVRNETIAHDSATGDQKAFAMPPMILVLSDAKFKNQVAVIVGEAPGALREIDGVLGPTALGITRIELDWEQKCLRWDTQ